MTLHEPVFRQLVEQAPCLAQSIREEALRRVAA